MSNTPPKSALELVLDRLRQQDAEAGTVATSFTDAQKEAIAEARQTCEAKTAESRILYESARLTVRDPAASRELDGNYRRDLARCISARDRKIKEIQKGD